MGKIVRDHSNLFPLPRGAFLRNRKYVYINTSSSYVRSSERKTEGTRGYIDHESVCIGVIADPDAPERMFYANERYRAMMGVRELPDPLQFADSLTVGLYCLIRAIAERSGLSEDLSSAFGEDAARQILDCSHYMLSRESAVMQHYPSWAREHALFSEGIRDATALGKFLRYDLSREKIDAFLDLWAVRNIPGNRVNLYLCYDSTETNCQAEGVSIVQDDLSEDDPSPGRVNTDYVVRQEDGLPFTYLHTPGSVSGIAQAQEMRRFMDRLSRLSQKSVSLALICDRGSISEQNLRQMDDAGIGYLLMLHPGSRQFEQISDSVTDEIRSRQNRLVTADGDEKYGLTGTIPLYPGGPRCHVHVIWSAGRDSAGRHEVDRKVAAERKKLEAFLAESRGKSFLPEELRWVSPYFRLTLERGEPRVVESRTQAGGAGAAARQLETVRVLGYADDEDSIHRAYRKAGIMILVTSEEMTAQKCLDEFAKRECVEETFASLKSHPGMDRTGIPPEESMRGKGLVWFVASILTALIFKETAALRASNREGFSVPAVVRELEAVRADRDPAAGRRQRRFKMTDRQREILNCWHLDEQSVDEAIGGLTV